MIRKITVLGLLGLITAAVTGCATTSNQPYGLKGNEQKQDQRYVDSKGHYRYDLQMMGVNAR